MELCHFTDPEVDQLLHCFSNGTIFRPFDSSMKSDCLSEVWIAFPSFFTLTGLFYIQGMPMVWRVLYTLEHFIENEGIDIGLSELSRLYNLGSNGSHRFLFKHKPQKPHPLLKVTKNDSNWRSQFFFVRRDSIPNGNHLP
ncbi:hypothetical protein Hanom_Chr04g00335571 [Helianthus anomalus]